MTSRPVPNLQRKVQFYSPPAITHRIAAGMHPGNPRVTIREVATALDGAEVILKPAVGPGG